MAAVAKVAKVRKVAAKRPTKVAKVAKVGKVAAPPAGQRCVTYVRKDRVRVCSWSGNVAEMFVLVSLLCMDCSRCMLTAAAY